MDKSVIAQVITTAIAFAVFFWISKKLFWTSILEAIEDRQRRIQGEFDKIESMKKSIDSLQEDYSQRMANIESEARQKMQEAISHGRKIADDITDEARRNADQEMERVRQMVHIEMNKARAELKVEVVNMTVAATEKIIRQQLDAEAQRKQVEQFVEGLSTL